MRADLFGNSLLVGATDEVQLWPGGEIFVLFLEFGIEGAV
jgi:hypothetical protein